MVYVIRARFIAGSASVRLDDFRAGIMAWLDSPIIGNGLDNHTYVIRYMSSFRSNNLGFSNSITSVMARGGLVYLFAYLLPLGMLVKNGSKDEKLGMAIYFLLWCVTIVTEIPINIYIFSLP